MQKKWEPPLPTRVGKKKKRGPDPTQKRTSTTHARVSSGSGFLVEAASLLHSSGVLLENWKADLRPL